MKSGFELMASTAKLGQVSSLIGLATFCPWTLSIYFFSSVVKKVQNGYSNRDNHFNDYVSEVSIFSMEF